MQDTCSSLLHLLLGVVIDLILYFHFLLFFLGKFSGCRCLGCCGSLLFLAITLFFLATMFIILFLLLKHVTGACHFLLAGAIFFPCGQQGENRIPASVCLQDFGIDVFDIGNHKAGYAHLDVTILLLRERIRQVTHIGTATRHDDACRQLVLIA